MVRRVVAARPALDIEFIALGITAPVITELMPGSSGTIDGLDDLLPVLFSTVQRAILDN